MSEDTQQIQEERFSLEEAVIPSAPALTLDIKDGDLVDFIDAYITRSKAFFDGEKNLKKRRELNERFYFGRQIKDMVYNGVIMDSQIKDYEKPFIDNVIKEGEDMLRPLLMSRLPDFIVKPGSDKDISEKVAEKVGDVVNKTIQSRDLRKVFNRALRHHPVYFTGVIKWRWDANKGKFGDIVFEAIHPKNILVDSNATINNEDEMEIIVHYVEKPLKKWIQLFPDKKEELLDYAKKKGKFDGKMTEEAMAVNLKLEEVWFDWQEEAENFDPENPEFNFNSGVCWKADKVILGKSQNPNWDWDGKEILTFEGQPIPPELVEELALIGNELPGIERKTIYRNYFATPRKPFIFIGYEQFGEMPLDETSRIEENLYLQENYDSRGMQITKKIDDSQGKHVFSALSGMKRKDLQKMDMADPNEDIFVDGKLSDVHSFIVKEQPSQQMFMDLERSKERILARVHVHGSTRGEIQTDTATTSQIAREADYTVADDIADDTINEPCTQMAEALLHIMKLRYTPEHFMSVLGEEAEEILAQVQDDMIEDGTEIEIYASGTDKLKAEREAKEDASMGLIDPLTYYKDTGKSDPEGRAEKLYMYQNNPELYLKKYVMGEDVPDIAEQVGLMNQQNLAGAEAQAGGMPPAPPGQPSPQDTTNIPTTPSGSPRGIGGAISNLFGR